MRLIDADALRDEFVYEISKFEPNEVLCVIDYAPTIDPAQYGEWISVKDHLPDKSGYYLAYGSLYGVPNVYSYSVEHRLWNTKDEFDDGFSQEVAIDGITHWCEFPPLPTDEGSMT